MADECKAWQITCRIGNAVDQVTGSAVSSAIKTWSDGVLEALDETIVKVSTWWLKLPAPALSGEGSAVPWVNSVTGFATVAIAVGSLIVAGILLMVHQRGEDLRRIAWGMLMMVAASGTAMAIMTSAIGLGDEFSSWVLSEATQGDESHFMVQLLDISVITLTPGTPVFFLLVIGLVGFIANLVQAVLMLVRSAMLILLVGTIPLAAAASVTGWGQAWLKKTFGWAVAFVLFKPVASLIYAIGIRMVLNDSFQAENDAGVLYSMLLGVVMLVLATLSLPALVSFMVPAAAGMGGGGSFAAGAALGGSMASGAMRVSAEPKGSVDVNASTSGSGGSGTSGDQASGAKEGTSTTGKGGSSGESSTGGPSGAGSAGQEAKTAGSAGGASSGASGAGTAGAGASGAGGAAAGGSATSGAAAAGAGAATGGVGAVVVKGIEAAKGAADAATSASNDAVKGNS